MPWPFHRGGSLLVPTVVMLAVIGVWAQKPASQSNLSFDVAVVKINRSGLPGGFSEIHPGGRFTETNQTLRQIILDAYGIEGFRILGGPSWMGTDRFDVEGRAGRDVPREQLLMMLRALLADRFA